MGDIDKQSFLLSINQDTVFDNEFYKKVYGYSVLDKEFIKIVASILYKLDKQDVAKKYNSWLRNYNEEQSQIMKSVSNWYSKECEKKYGIIKKEQVCNENVVEIPRRKEVRSSEEWKRKRKELLLQKKKLIIMQNLKQ
ncbi:hypothetical protein GCM10023142_10990 [Anaerocolumna aminovalerica]|uniref:hypothetical protein n=1 Tax=Anaerocolumna aminovalerica TaxID=1527 RepID=UPI000B806C08|nr:hypothetical protein [Anaerocolumna aminovalerica]